MSLCPVREEKIMTRESFVNNERKHNVKTNFWLLAIITVICVMMLAGCTKKVEKPVATQPAGTTESPTKPETTEPETTEPETTVLETQNPINARLQIGKVMKFMKAEKTEYLTPYVWNKATNEARQVAHGEKVQLNEAEVLLYNKPEGFDSDTVVLAGKDIVDGSEVGVAYTALETGENYIIINFLEFSGEVEFTIGYGEYTATVIMVGN